MSLESSVVSLLAPLCPRVFPDVAPEGVDKPYVTYQGLGGESWRYLDNAPAAKRNVLLQINVWATTRAESLTLARQIEDALCAAAALEAIPQSEPLWRSEPDTRLYGTNQRFTIVAPR